MKKKSIHNYLLFACVIVLCLITFMSISSPIRFNRERETREEAVKNRLLQIRQASEAFMKANGIIPMAWGPLRFDLDKTHLKVIGEKYGKNWAQVVLRRNFQKGIVSIPKSHSFEHQKENLDIFDFELTEEETEIF